MSPSRVRRRAGRRPRSSRRTRTDEYFGSLHPPADRHLAVDGGAGAGRHRGLSAVARRAAAAGRFSDHPGQRHGAGRQPGNHGRHRRHAARAPVRPDRRRRAEMSSVSSLGSTVITLQFDLNRNIDGAAQDVQAAITAAGSALPKNLSTPPTYRKVNPADSPILIVLADSDTVPLPKVDDFAENVVAQQISQISGVAQVAIGGQQKPAIRVQVDPAKLQARQITLEDVRNALTNATTAPPKGTLLGKQQSLTIVANDQLVQADDYNNVIIAYRNGAPVHVRDVGQAIDGPQDVTLGALHGVHVAVVLLVFKQPGANVIDTVDNIKSALKGMSSLIPPGIHLDIIVDRTQTIRASVKDVEFTLLLSCALVVLVILLFLRSIHATLIPGAAVPLSLLGAVAIIYLLGYSLDNLSLMALT